jgi:acyl-CoA synthetase (AMP-forming)/AMP-acid ligase II
MLTGASLVLPTGSCRRRHSRMISTLKVTKAGAVPTIWSDLLRYLGEHPEIDISSPNSTIVGGSACPPALMRAYEERYGVRVLYAWGMTEMRRQHGGGAAVAATGDGHGPTGRARSPGVHGGGGWSLSDGTMPWDPRASVRGARAVDHGLVLPGRRGGVVRRRLAAHRRRR